MAETSPLGLQVLSCWNWKCALISATARSVVYLLALTRTGARGSIGIVLVEMAYVALTSGVYAGIQQKALGIRSRIVGNCLIVIGVPWLAQGFDWLAHRAAGAATPPKATAAVLMYATVSALFHLYVMRRGAFLTGREGSPLGCDFRRIPWLMSGFAMTPFRLVAIGAARLNRVKGVEAAY
jgi:hypothetical protein